MVTEYKPLLLMRVVLAQTPELDLPDSAILNQTALKWYESRGVDKMQLSLALCQEAMS